MTLSQTLLDAARDEVAKSYGLESSLQYHVNLEYQTFEEIIEFESKAALLAMEKQAEFYREISHQGYVCLFRSQLWTNPKTDETKTELELYNIWREGK